MDMNNYYNEMIEAALDGFKRINNCDTIDHQTFEAPTASWECYASRGDVLEKATISRVRINTVHPDTGEDTKFHALQSKIYPASPRVPILIFIIEHMQAADDFFSGMMDVIPPVAIDEDLALLGAEMKKVADKHGEDYEALRRKGAAIFKLPLWEKPINAGVGIHNPTAKERLDMIREEGRVWLKLYFELVEKRKDDAFTDDDLQMMNKIRVNIMEYYYVGDRSLPIAQQIGIPLEAINMSLIAPTLRF